MSLTALLRRARPSGSEFFRSLAVALGLGLIMNSLGHWWCIAHFAHWWQVVTCYGGYVLPVALLVRDRPVGEQLLWGLVSMVPLELAGYALGTSVPCPDNWLDPILGPRNFSLAMVVVGTPTPWLVNTLAGWLRPRGR
jgi:hypothetical protein